MKPKKEGDMETVAVLFVPRTPKGELLRKVRGRETDLQKILGNKIRCVEKAGRKLEHLISQKDPWESDMCRGGPKGSRCQVCKEGGKAFV